MLLHLLGGGLAGVRRHLHGFELRLVLDVHLLLILRWSDQALPIAASTSALRGKGLVGMSMHDGVFGLTNACAAGNQ